MSESGLDESSSNSNIREVLEGMRTLALEVEELRRQNISMRNLLDKSDQSSSFLSKFRVQRDNNQSQKRIVDLEGEVGRMKQEIILTEERFNELNVKSKKQALEVKTLKQQLADQTAQSSELEQNLKLEVDRNEQLEMKISSQSKEIEATIHQNTDTVEKLQDEINTLKTSNDFMKSEMNSVKEYLDIAERKLMEFEASRLEYQFATRNLYKLRFPTWTTFSVAWMANDRLATFSFDSKVTRSGHAVSVRLTANGHTKNEMKIIGTYIRSFALRTDNKLVTGSADGTVSLWHHDKKVNEVRGSIRFTTKSKIISSMTKAFNNRVLACYSTSARQGDIRPGTSRIANIELLGPSLNVEKTFQGSRKETTTIAFNGQQLIGTGGLDMIVRIYNINGSSEPVKVSSKSIITLTMSTPLLP